MARAKAAALLYYYGHGVITLLERDDDVYQQNRQKLVKCPYACFYLSWIARILWLAFLPGSGICVKKFDK